jgi:hypothetical protein
MELPQFIHPYKKRQPMKGLLLGVGFLLINIATVTQRVFNAYETGISTLDTVNSTWIYNNAKPANLTVTIQNKVACMNDWKKSTYRLKEEGFAELTEEIKSQRVWQAADKNGINCELSVIHFRSDTVRIQITYPNHKYLKSIFYNVAEMSK